MSIWVVAVTLLAESWHTHDLLKFMQACGLILTLVIEGTKESP